MKTLSLFTGAGGLDLGLERVGFDVAACIEIDENARNTIKKNRPNWNLLKRGDIFSYSPEELLSEAGIKRKELTLLSGGPPCQPFSNSALWTSNGALRLKDPRSKTFNIYLDILEYALPEVFLLENVKGLSKAGSQEIQIFRDGLHRINKENRSSYNLQILTLNAAAYGIPQLRERVFLIGHRKGYQLNIPPPTHGHPSNLSHGMVPWKTAWEAIGDLDQDNWDSSLSIGGKWSTLVPSIPEGNNYLWHTPRGGGVPVFGWRTRYWTFLLKLAKNKPSWTLQASPGTATGPFHWKNRKLSIQEIGRLQTFPENYIIEGSYHSARKQLGNAVPCALSELIGQEIRHQFFGEKIKKKQQPLSLSSQKPCPPPEPLLEVPKTYMAFCNDHKPHPGPGLGPQPRLI